LQAKGRRSALTTHFYRVHHPCYRIGDTNLACGKWLNQIHPGKGAVKLTKELIGIGNSSFQEALENAKEQEQAKTQRLLLRSPEIGIKNALLPGIDRVKLSGIKCCEIELQEDKISHIIQYILPCLYIGCVLWFDPEVALCPDQMIRQAGMEQIADAKIIIQKAEISKVVGENRHFSPGSTSSSTYGINNDNSFHYVNNLKINGKLSLRIS